MTKIFVDTNKFLDFYRYKEENKEILDKLAASNNLVLTEQVIREFKRNRISEIRRLLEKVEEKEKQITNNMCNLEPVGIFTDTITALNKTNTKHIQTVKESFKPLEDDITAMIEDDKNDVVFTAFNKIIQNQNTLILNDDEEAYSLAVKRNNLGGVPRSDKSGYKSLTICDEYIWDTILLESNFDILFVTRDDTYLNNAKILSEEYRAETGKTIKFVEYVSTALSELGEEISEEAKAKEQKEQENLLIANKIHDLMEIDSERLEGILVTLTMREEQIIRLRFGLDSEEPKTLEQVAEMFGISIEEVRKIESKALMKMRNRYVHDKDIVISL